MQTRHLLYAASLVILLLLSESCKQPPTSTKPGDSSKTTGKEYLRKK